MRGKDLPDYKLLQQPGADPEAKHQESYRPPFVKPAADMYGPFPRKQGVAQRFLHRRPSRAFSLAVAMVVITASIFVVLSPSYQKHGNTTDIAPGSNQAGEEPSTKLLVEGNDPSEGETKDKESGEAAQQAKPESPVTVGSDDEVDDKEAMHEDAHDADKDASEDQMGGLDESEGVKGGKASVASQPDFAPEGNASDEGNDMGVTVDDDGNSNEPGDDTGHSNDASDNVGASSEDSDGSVNLREEADDELDSKSEEDHSVKSTTEEGEGDKDLSEEGNDDVNSNEDDESDVNSIEKGSDPLNSSESDDNNVNSIEEGVESVNLSNDGNDGGDSNEEDDGGVTSNEEGEDGGSLETESNTGATPDNNDDEGANSGDTADDRDDSSDVATSSTGGAAAVQPARISAGSVTTEADKTISTTFENGEQVTGAEDLGDSTFTTPNDGEVAFDSGEPGTNPEPDANELYDTPEEKLKVDVEQPATELASGQNSVAPKTAAEGLSTADDDDSDAPVVEGDLVNDASKIDSSSNGEVEAEDEGEVEMAKGPKEEANEQGEEETGKEPKEEASEQGEEETGKGPKEEANEQRENDEERNEE